MGRIRIVWGTAAGPTAMASYDAALAAANVHNYNLVSVSSVIPANAEIEVVGEAPDLGPPGERLTVVEGRSTIAPGNVEPAVASLGWSREANGPGIFYETSGTDPDAVRSRIDAGLAAGRELRDWAFEDDGRRTVVAESSPNRHTTAVVLAVYGESGSIL
ncbi:MAG: pyruvoyl-dependent arginine decarboxylase [Natronomonas sp.]|uniref:arginine decarboxylase n=1 Tax=Natronomonas salsuginis TaxID=2217661 RepID=A0A4U5JEE8_9EURY|nr:MULTISPECIES: pyruvoyl-dependent arginine decarboxylase [Natronomonas]MDR9380839.1 pyruvoyl-dependent arginine decarboxylase [Natronomonas sp.]MDR9430876.1 pyruvoyl-dependent arginine decarboxylase [Natronomonas sp.]TKR27810.1 pyruvoyl-dependent arginine decarboxylase [Natronomonas salsuginis]